VATDKLLIIGLAAALKPFAVLVFLCFSRAIQILLNKIIPDGKIKNILNRKI